jgi:GDPmannose 4,6-dehydratase
MKKAVIFGVTGQDGSYLAEYLLDLGYTVVGVHRRSSVDTTERLTDILCNKLFILEEGDITDESSVTSIIIKHLPEEIYNLSAQSHVQTSFEQPHYTFAVNACGFMNILEVVRRNMPYSKVYQASTSEMFGNNKGCIVWSKDGESVDPYYLQDETIPFSPASPYAISKVAAHNMAQMYREAYNLLVCCGILFNHESPRRGDNFVTKKIAKYCGWLYNEFKNKSTQQIDQILCDNDLKLHLGNLDACRDWGHAKDYVVAMHIMLQQDSAKDYVVATGEAHSVREFCDAAFNRIGVEHWRNFVYVDPKFVRPLDVNFLCGDSTQARESLGWCPCISFSQLVEDMVDHEIRKYDGILSN